MLMLTKKLLRATYIKHNLLSSASRWTIYRLVIYGNATHRNLCPLEIRFIHKWKYLAALLYAYEIVYYSKNFGSLWKDKQGKVTKDYKSKNAVFKEHTTKYNTELHR